MKLCTQLAKLMNDIRPKRPVSLETFCTNTHERNEPRRLSLSFYNCALSWSDLSVHLFGFLFLSVSSPPAGLRASALLSLLSPNEPEPCPPSPERSQELSISDTSSLPGSTAALCSPPSSLYKTLSADDALDSPSLSSEGTLSPELRGETAWHIPV